jgi:glutamate synthase (NADPH/NADH) large chain
MARSGEEAIGSMGNDAALPVLSRRPKVLYSYFKQLFAQVTNPPIDPIREELVMSLVTFIGPRPNLLAVDVPADAENLPMRLEATQPILTNSAMEKIRHAELFTGGAFKTFELDICYPAAWGANGMEAALASISAAAEDAINLGYNILVVSDRKVSADLMPIPALLATAAVHQHLVRKGLRTSTGLVVENGLRPRGPSLRAAGGLRGRGGPSLPRARDAAHAGGRPARVRAGSCVPLHQVNLEGSLQGDVQDGHLHVSVVLRRADLRGGRAAAGLRRQVLHRHREQRRRHRSFRDRRRGIPHAPVGFGDDPLLANALDAGGEYMYRIRGEDHMWTPDSIAKLQHAARTGNVHTYKEYAALINDQSKRMLTLRGLFELRYAHVPIPLEDVEPAAEIVKRFATGAMSLGSISTEAHTTLAVAMNRIGGKSNTGEGGEDSQRYPLVKAGETLRSRIPSAVTDIALKEGDSLRSKIKQVASARFGVTAEYLVNADQLQIKIAQGAKPGEGGQLPGHKVSGYIAELRYAVPGVGLISPPPHHDIYSIEDLAQLIHDSRTRTTRHRFR